MTGTIHQNSARIMELDSSTLKRLEKGEIALSCLRAHEVCSNEMAMVKYRTDKYQSRTPDHWVIAPSEPGVCDICLPLSRHLASRKKLPLVDGLGVGLR